MSSSDRQYINRLFYCLTVPQNWQNIRLLAPSVSFWAILLTVGLHTGITIVRCYTKGMVSCSTPVYSPSQKAPMTSRSQVCYTKHPISCSTHLWQYTLVLFWAKSGQAVSKNDVECRFWVPLDPETAKSLPSGVSRCTIPAGRSCNIIRYAIQQGKPECFTKRDPIGTSLGRRAFRFRSPA